MPDLLLTWVQSADDPTLSGDVVSYEIARGPAPNPVAVVATIAATPAGGDTLHSETVDPGAYWYRVRAVDGAGNRSLWSDEAHIVVTERARVAALVRIRGRVSRAHLVGEVPAPMLAGAVEPLRLVGRIGRAGLRGQAK